VLAFAEANAALLAVQRDAWELLKAEMDRRGVSAKAQSEARAGYEKSPNSRRLPLLAKIRESDARLAEALVGFLDLADGKLGKWTVEPGTTQLVFDTDAAVARYNELLAQVRAIGAEQERLQKQVLAIGQ